MTRKTNRPIGVSKKQIRKAHAENRKRDKAKKREEAA